jgi:hypothetical protein
MCKIELAQFNENLTLHRRDGWTSTVLNGKSGYMHGINHLQQHTTNLIMQDSEATIVNVEF